MGFELLPLKPDQHTVTFVPRVTLDLPFFNLTTRRKQIPKVIRYEGRDENGHPIRWQVYQDTSKEIGAPAVEAHEVWYLLVKPAIDSQRLPDGTIPEIIPLGGIRECLRKVGWTAGGHQARELIKALTQISFAGCVADLWVPTGEQDQEGRQKFLQIKGRFSRLSVYAIGEYHLTKEELETSNFKFDLEDILYIRLDPLEARLQQLQDRRVLDNQYLFSISPAARRWYELMAAKIFGVVVNNGSFCEIRYSWYIQHHHTLKRFYERRRVVEQMNRLVRDHLQSGYLNSIEYRAVKEPDAELDYIIRYYPGPGAKESNVRIQTFIREKRNRKKLNGGLSRKEKRIVLERIESPVEAVKLNLITQEQIETERLVHDLFRLFGITIFKSLQLVTTNRNAVLKQLEYWPFRTVTAKSGVAGWMISAIERNYAAPPGFVDAAEQKKEAVAAERKLTTIAACHFCDERGFIKIESRDFEGQVTMRICTHDFEVERPLAVEREAKENSKTSPDALKRSGLNDNSLDDKRAAENSVGS
jgi:hypothetical protein